MHAGEHTQPRQCFCTPEEVHLSFAEFVAAFRASQRSGAPDIPYLQARGWEHARVEGVLDNPMLRCVLRHVCWVMTHGFMSHDSP